MTADVRNHIDMTVNESVLNISIGRVVGLWQPKSFRVDSFVKTRNRFAWCLLNGAEIGP